jgi:hypothetical protein
MAQVVSAATADFTQKTQRAFFSIVLKLGGLLAVGADDAGAGLAVFFFNDSQHD